MEGCAITAVTRIPARAKGAPICRRNPGPGANVHPLSGTVRDRRQSAPRSTLDTGLRRDDPLSSSFVPPWFDAAIVEQLCLAVSSDSRILARLERGLVSMGPSGPFNFVDYIVDYPASTGEATRTARGCLPCVRSPLKRPETTNARISSCGLDGRGRADVPTTGKPSAEPRQLRVM